MEFKGQPNLYVKIVNKQLHRLTNIKGISFNSEGIYETENPVLIKALSVHFEKIDEENTVNGVREEIKGKEIAEKKICKQCGEGFENMGSLLAHIRKDHPKGGKK